MKSLVACLALTSPFVWYGCVAEEEVDVTQDPLPWHEAIEATTGSMPELDDSAQGSLVRVLNQPVLQSDAMLVERYRDFVSVEVEADSLAYRFRGDNPLRVGMVVGGGYGGGYIRRIESVHVGTDNRVVCRTREAALEELFARLDLAIAYRPADRPTELTVREADCHDVAPCRPAGRVDAERLTGINALRSAGNCDFGADGNVEFAANLDFDFDADFNVRVRRAFDFYVETRGEASASVGLSGEGAVEGACQADFAEAIFPRAPWTLLRFSVLGIPGRIYAFPVLDGHFTAEASGDFSAEVRLNATDARVIGWRDRQWVNERSTTVDFNRSLSADGEVEAEAGLRMGLGLGVEIGLNLGLVRAKGAVEASVYGAVRPRFHAESHGDAVGGNLECPWSFDMPVSIELEARAHAELGVLWWSVNPEQQWGPFTLWEDSVLSGEGDFCGRSECTPQACRVLGCGDHADDGCGNPVSCACETGCVPLSECTRSMCGTVDDGCGGTLRCGDNCSVRDRCFDRHRGWCPEDELCTDELPIEGDELLCPDGQDPIYHRAG